jgi:hypothetical protein
MHAILKSSGNMPFSMDLLNIFVRELAITSTLSFRSFGDIRLCPVSYEVLILKISLVTSKATIS